MKRERNRESRRAAEISAVTLVTRKVAVAGGYKWDESIAEVFVGVGVHL